MGRKKGVGKGRGKGRGGGGEEVGGRGREGDGEWVGFEGGMEGGGLRFRFRYMVWGLKDMVFSPMEF